PHHDGTGTSLTPGSISSSYHSALAKHNETRADGSILRDFGCLRTDRSERLPLGRRVRRHIRHTRYSERNAIHFRQPRGREWWQPSPEPVVLLERRKNHLAVDRDSRPDSDAQRM